MMEIFVLKAPPKGICVYRFIVLGLHGQSLTGFCSIKQLGVLLLPPGWMLVHHRVTSVTPRGGGGGRYSLSYPSKISFRW